MSRAKFETTLPSEEELSEIAQAFREMADAARDLRFKFEFAEHAERYETVRRAMRRKRESDANGD